MPTARYFFRDPFATETVSAIIGVRQREIDGETVEPRARGQNRDLLIRRLLVPGPSRKVLLPFA